MVCTLVFWIFYHGIGKLKMYHSTTILFYIIYYYCPYTWYHLTMVLPWYYHSIFYFYHGNAMVFWYTMVFCITIWRTHTIFLEIPCKYNVIWVPIPSYISKAYHNISLWCTMYITCCKCSILSLSHCVYVCIRMSASERFPESQPIKQKSALNSREEMAIIK